MEVAEEIRHKKRFDIFEQLAQEKTLLKMSVLGQSFEHLTMVTGIRFRKNTPCFFVDYPDGFREATASEKKCRMRFEFIGSDRVTYRFKTAGSEIVHDEVCIEFPEVIHRLQRRNDFRVAPPVGTKLCFQKNDNRYEMSVLNLSRRGALVTMTKEHAQNSKTPIFTAGNRVKNLSCLFPAKADTTDVQIKSAQVIRVGKNPVTGRHTCAFHFDDIETDQEKRIIRLLYKFQREFLQKK